ncbi:cyclophilin B [Pelomyxa schiedti]|nr:cyclophilin B [Pelomyxa schiedti]
MRTSATTQTATPPLPHSSVNSTPTTPDLPSVESGTSSSPPPGSSSSSSCSSDTAVSTQNQPQPQSQSQSQPQPQTPTPTLTQQRALPQSQTPTQQHRVTPSLSSPHLVLPKASPASPTPHLTTSTSSPHLLSCSSASSSLSSSDSSSCGPDGIAPVGVNLIVHKRLTHDVAALEARLARISEKQAALKAKLQELEAEEKEKTTLLQQTKSALKKISVDFTGDPSNGVLHICRAIPNKPVKPVTDAIPLHVIDGPLNESMQSFQGIACARSISTYPISPTSHTKQGEPICDHYSIHMFDKLTTFCITDGCNWGVKPRDAAKAACTAFTKFLSESLCKINNIKDISPIVINALVEAHNAVIRGKPEAWEVGTTTLLGGCIVPLADYKKTKRKGPQTPTPETYACILIGVGDCKAFFWSSTEHRFSDMTCGNHSPGGTEDRRDPGGRLGPYVDCQHPDLRNLRVWYTEAIPGDMILCASDGVHDNLTPEFLGVQPGDLCARFSAMSWEEAMSSNMPLAHNLCETYMASKLEEIVFSAKSNRGFLHGSMLSNDVTPTSVANSVLEYCQICTQESRDWMEKNPDKKLPVDYKLYPGKMDHTTCIVIQVGGLGSGPLQAGSSAAPPTPPLSKS